MSMREINYSAQIVAFLAALVTGACGAEAFDESGDYDVDTVQDPIIDGDTVTSTSPFIRILRDGSFSLSGQLLNSARTTSSASGSNWLASWDTFNEEWDIEFYTGTASIYSQITCKRM